MKYSFITFFGVTMATLGFYGKDADLKKNLTISNNVMILGQKILSICAENVSLDLDLRSEYAEHLWQGILQESISAAEAFKLLSKYAQDGISLVEIKSLTFTELLDRIYALSHASHSASNNIPEKQLCQNIKPCRNDKLAIVRVACKLPGGVNCLEDLWVKVLQPGANVVDYIPAERWDRLQFLKSNNMYAQKMGYIEDAEYFDNEFFEIPLSEVRNIEFK